MSAYAGQSLSLSPNAKANLLPYLVLRQRLARDDKEKEYWESVAKVVEKESER